MSFMIKKKKYKFQVDFLLEELSAVPFVNGVLFAKVRLLEGGSFTEMSPKEEVLDHCVRWGTRFTFCCKMSANASTGVLDSCICRVSVRKEVKGGRSFHKLGFADLDLAEFAGAGMKRRRFLLEGYDTKHRQDNSMLQVTLEMTLLSGDPCFKAITVPQTMLLGEQGDEQLQAERKGDDYSGGSVASGSSGFGSLPRKQRPSVLSSDLVTGGEAAEGSRDDAQPQEFELGHSRNSSYASQQSKLSGYSSLHSHSRQGSSDSGHMRNLSSGSAYSDMGLTIPPKPPERKRPSGKKQLMEENRMDSTRVNADQLIDELLQSTNLVEADEAADTIGLQLFVGKDGTASVSSRDMKRMTGGSFEKVVIHR